MSSINKTHLFVIILSIVSISISIGLWLQLNALQTTIQDTDLKTDILGRTYVEIEGPSMIPTFQPGDIVYIQPIDNMNDLKIDDIVAFQSPYSRDYVIVHRVAEIRVSADGLVFRTKGNNNQIRDPWQIYEEHIIGIVEK